MTKVCTKCKLELPATKEYFSKGNNKSGLRAYCKECGKAYNKQWNKENKTYYDKWRSLHKEELKEYLRNYNIQNKESISIRKKEYQQLNADKYLAYQKEYMRKNKERLQEYRREYHLKNIEKITRNVREWESNNYKRNRESCRMTLQRRKARINNLKYTLTAEEWSITKDNFNNECAYCGEKIKLEQEHIIPVSKGGPYTKENIIPACKSCNCKKSNKDLDEWYPKQKFYTKERENKIILHMNVNKGVR